MLYVDKLLCRTIIEYEVIGEPPLLVAVQLIVTPVLETAVVVGIAGVDGSDAARTYASLEAIL